MFDGVAARVLKKQTARRHEGKMMGLRKWWSAYQVKAEEIRYSTKLNSDQSEIAFQVPELVGMSDVEGMAYTLQQIDAWKATCTIEEASEFSRLGQLSIESFENNGLMMPYWGSLWVLRTYQKSLGLDVPDVAPPANST